MAVACTAVSPLSGTPFVTTVCGLSVAALSAQLLLRRRTVWPPDPLQRHRVAMDRPWSGMRRADRVAGMPETVLRRRWVWITRGPAQAALPWICLGFGLAMPLLEVVPFAGTTLASAALLIALALIARDGLAAIIAGLVV
ncbi:MAG: exopolysaccharide biosynthesis protein [Pseudomonadota bacterium]